MKMSDFQFLSDLGSSYYRIGQRLKLKLNDEDYKIHLFLFRYTRQTILSIMDSLKISYFKNKFNYNETIKNKIISDASDTCEVLGEYFKDLSNSLEKQEEQEENDNTDYDKKIREDVIGIANNMDFLIYLCEEILKRGEEK